MKVALIKNNIVENLIESSLEFAQTLGYDSVIVADGTMMDLGDKLINGIWTNQPKKGARIISFYEFLKRFTFEERKVIITFKKTSLDVEDLWAMWSIAPFINLDSQETIGFLNLLVSSGLLTAPRLIEITT